MDCAQVRRFAFEIADHRHRRLLRPRRERPRRRRAAEEGDEIAPPNVICHPIFPAQSAREEKDGITPRPDGLRPASPKGGAPLLTRTGHRRPKFFALRDSYSITCSARTSNGSGTVNPSVVAVLR